MGIRFDALTGSVEIADPPQWRTERPLAVRMNRDAKAGDWLCAQGNPHRTKADAESCSRDFLCGPDPDYGF